MKITLDRSLHCNAGKAKWLLNNETVSINDITITGGLIYVGEYLPAYNGSGMDAALINPMLALDFDDPGNQDIGYWPKYAGISAGNRTAYLLWLSKDRDDPYICISYVFLYFYGLERRLLVDGQRQPLHRSERKAIRREIKRLLIRYVHSRSFSNYARGLLAVEHLLYGEDDPLSDDDLYSSEGYTFIFKIALARVVHAGKPLPVTLARIWGAACPGQRLGIPARRCPLEFNQLFAIRYQERYGDGLIVKPNAKSFHLSYTPASPSFKPEKRQKHLYAKTPFPLLDLNLPDPIQLKKPARELNILAKICVEELTAYSCYVAVNGATSARQLLPLPLQTGSDTGIQTFKLDLHRIQQQQRETEQVQDVLQAIFINAEEETTCVNDASSVKISRQFGELDEAHQRFLGMLITQTQWERETLKKFSFTQGLMLDGALEVINDWAFTLFDSALIEDGDPLFIHSDVVLEIVNGQTTTSTTTTGT